jgi:hypothetical protein
MSIFYICGKPGSGKSYVAVEHILKELADPKSDRFIVTNIELKFEDRQHQQLIPPPWYWTYFGWFLRLCGRIPPPPNYQLRTTKGLVTWCHENIKHEVNLKERIRILDDSECGEFWNYEPGYKFEKRRELDLGRRKMDVPDFEDRAKRGCLYVIDEVHVYFGARDWQATGADCTFFLSQHRKLQCDVILITQHPEQTDKALRRLAQEYMSMRNLMREPILGFRLGNYFRYVRSLNSPQSANPAVFETGFVTLKPEEVGGLYDTTAGVGIAGRVAPRSEKRGRSIWWLLPPIVIIVAAGIFLFTHVTMINRWISHAMAKAFFGGATAVTSGIAVPNSTNLLSQFEKPANQPSDVSPHVTKAADSVSDSTARTGHIFSEDELPPVEMSGYCKIANKWVVTLSDGRTFESGDDELKTLAKKYCVIGTNIFYLHHFDPRTISAPPLYYSYSPPDSQPFVQSSVSQPSYVPHPPVVYTIPNRSPLDAATGGYRGHVQDISSRFQNQTTSQNHVETQ